jgi:hypothetical protein
MTHSRMGQSSRRLFERPSWLSIGWMIVLLHTVGAARSMLEGQSTPRYRYAAIYFVLLAAIGTLRGWGLPVLFALGGFSITFYWQPFGGVSSDEMDAVMHWIGLPAISGVLGACLAYGIELLQPFAARLARHVCLPEDGGWPPVSSTTTLPWRRVTAAEGADGGKADD